VIGKYFFFALFFLFSLAFSQNQEANDCVNYIQICGNETISLNPTGYGTQELDAGQVCNSEEHNSLWLKFTVKTSGTLGFDLIPNNPDIWVDYDFWIFGPDVSCKDIGFSVRCSTTNPAAALLENNHTGMRDSEPAGDFFEGPGDLGDGYIKSLDVIAGESYFLVIDRPIGDGSFVLNWTGTAMLEDPFGTAPYSFGNIPPISLCNTSSVYDFSKFTNQILNGNPDFEVSYYNTYEDATYDVNRITNPITLENHDYFYRIQSTVTECFRIVTIDVDWKPLTLTPQQLTECNINGKGIFNLTEAVFTDEEISSIKFYHTLQEAEDHTPGTEITNTTNYSSTGEKLYVWILSKGGCEAISTVDLIFYPIPNVDTNLYNANICDSNFDNSISIKFSDITPIIVDNPNNFEVNYYLSSNTTTPLPDDFTFTQNTTVIVIVNSKNGCPSASGKINFKFAPKIQLNNISPIEICDTDRSGSETINLNDYSQLFTTQANPTFYETLEEAKTKINSISFSQNINANRSYFFRFENNIDCPEIGELKLIFKNPKISDILKDVIICKENDINLDAGPGFTDYLWSTGSTTSFSGNVKVGEYWVDLTFDGCTTRQTVNVIAEEEVIIEVLEIENNTLTITATGGTPPYEYSLNGINWQSSNVFYDIPKGIHQVFVRSSKKCFPSVRAFSNINIVNVITPNGDGKNDVLNYSGLSLKENVTFKIYDRYGKNVFEARNGNYTWDGKIGGRNLPTGAYWYILIWTEPDTKVIHRYNSWILLKNR